MDISLYHLSLITALPLMLFFGFHMLFAPVPEKKDISNFLLSRKLMGFTLLILSANYMVHLFVGPRSIDRSAAILMNMETYFLCYWLFTAAMMTLLDRSFITRRRFVRNIIFWLVYSLVASAVSILSGKLELSGIFILVLILLFYGLYLTSHILKNYRRATKMFADTRSDDIGAYIRWLSIFTYLSVAYGVGCALFTFIPDEYVFIWILSSIPFYIYLFCCYQNYIFFFENVENAIIEEENTLCAEATEQGEADNPDEPHPGYHADIALRIDEWIGKEGFRTPGITLKDLSQHLGTNRTYLSQYINTVFKKPFRDWISDLRIEYAKQLMVQCPQMKILDVSESSGFLSLSHFFRTFSEKVGCSPAKWRHDKA